MHPHFLMHCARRIRDGLAWLWDFWFGPSLEPLPYSERPCAGRAWRRAFPDAKKDDLRDFLGILTDSMFFPLGHRLKFRPDDDLFDIYRSRYGDVTPWGDDLECETFVWGICERFGLDEDVVGKACNEDSTLGALFARTAGRA